jgi:bla regulator protein blaR1
MRLIPASLFSASVLVAGAASAVAQQPSAAPATNQAFEVATVRRNLKEQGPPVVAFQPGGRFVMTNAPLTALLGRAYPTPNMRVVGAPDWLGRESYDIIAKAPDANPTPTEMQAMLRALLADRFKLAVHFETRDQDVYDLVAANTGKVGPGLRKVDIDCDSRAAAAREGKPVERLPAADNGMAPCAIRAYDGGLLAGGITMAQLALSLNLAAGRTVIDKTGLAGRFEVTLNYRPGPVPVEGGDPGGVPPFFTAIQDQLGLKLQPGRTTVDVLVIDHIERPADN